MFLTGAVAELAEQSLPTPEVRGLDLNVFKIICQLRKGNKETEAGVGLFKNIVLALGHELRITR